MASSYFQFAPTIARNLASFDPNKPALLLLKVANLTGDFERDLGKKATALTPTLSSPQPQAGAMAGRLMNVLSSPLGVGPQETIRNFNPLPASPAAPTGASQGTFNIFTPLFNPTGLFNFVTTLNFEMLFNILVVLGLLYLFFTPPTGDDATAYESFGLVDPILPRGSELGGSKSASYPCRDSATGAARPSRPRKTRSTSDIKQVTLVPFSRSPAPRASQGISAKGFGCPIQPASITEPPAEVGPKEIASYPQVTRQNSGGLLWQDTDTQVVNGDARPEPFPPGATQISASLSPIIITDIVGSTEARNLETVDTEGETDSEVGKGKGKEVSGVVTIRHQHTFPLPVEAISSRNVGLVQRTVPPQARVPVTPSCNVYPQPQLPVPEASTHIQGPPPLPTPRLTVNISLPTVPVGPTHAIVPTTQAPPVSLSRGPAISTLLPTAPSSWLQQQVVVRRNSYFPVQSVAHPMDIDPQPCITRPTCTPVFIENHESKSDQHMDITDDDGDSWMRPSEFGEAKTPQESTPSPPIQILVIPVQDAPQCTRENGLAQEPTVVVACNPTPTVCSIQGFTGLDSRRLRKKVRTCRLPYGPRPSITPLAPSVKLWVMRLYRSVELRRRGSASAYLSARNKHIARASRLQKRFYLRNKIAARPPKPQHSTKPTAQVNDQPETVDPITPKVPPSTQRKARSYFDRLHATRASPFSQHGPSEVSLMACKLVPKSTSSKKAFIWQHHFSARDRRAVGKDGRISVTYGNNRTTGQRAVAGSQREPTPQQRKAPVGDHVYSRRKRPTAADFIRIEDTEKEKQALDAAVDALQSMGLNSEASVPAPSTSASASDAPVISSTIFSSSVTQDPEFHRDQAQLLLEDIFEGCEMKQNGLATSFPSSPSSFDSSSGPDSESDDD